MTRQLKRELLRRCAVLLAAALLLRSVPLWGPALLDRLAIPGVGQLRSLFSHSDAGQVPQPAGTVPAADEAVERELPPLRFRDPFFMAPHL